MNFGPMIDRVDAKLENSVYGDYLEFKEAATKNVFYGKKSEIVKSQLFVQLSFVSMAYPILVVIIAFLNSASGRRYETDQYLPFCRYHGIK